MGNHYREEIIFKMVYAQNESSYKEFITEYQIQASFKLLQKLARH